jgi:hypothetical protein
MSDDVGVFSPMRLPVHYSSLPVSHLGAVVQDVAYLYAACARDKATGSRDATTFEDAVSPHRLIDEITTQSVTGPDKENS